LIALGSFEQVSSPSVLLSSLELSNTKVYEPQIRALLGTASHFCEVVVLKLITFEQVQAAGEVPLTETDVTSFEVMSVSVRGSSRFESLILSHQSRFTCGCNQEEIDDDDDALSSRFRQRVRRR